MSLMNYLVRSYIRKWDHELKIISHAPEAVQLKQLELIEKSGLVAYLHARQKKAGQKNIVANSSLTSYEDIAQGIEKLRLDTSVKCRYYAQSSGTTSGKQKLIPTPEAFVKCNHLRGSWYLLHTLYGHDPTMSVFKQKNLLIGGSIYERRDDHILGDVSGIMISRIPSFFRPWYVPRIAEAIQPDWTSKLDITSTKAASEKNVALLAGTPTWVLSVLRTVLAKSEQRHLSVLWPNLKAYIHGGVDFRPYRHQFDQITEGLAMRYIEVYNATEGFFAYQDRPDKEGMMLMLNSGIYFEFISEDNYRSDIHDLLSLTEVELGINYVMVISTISGLVRYVQGDIVRFVTKAPYRIKVVSRIESYVNAFGEDLFHHQVQEALSKTNQRHHASISQYHVAPQYISIEHKGYHEWYIEWEKTPEEISEYEKDLDEALKTINPNYAQKRSGDIALAPLKIFNLPKGSAQRYFKEYSTLSAQSKLQRLRNDRKVADRLADILFKVDNTTGRAPKHSLS